MLQGDNEFKQFYYKDAHSNYVQAIEGYMNLMKQTQDDPNFQNFLRERINYIMERVILSHITV